MGDERRVAMALCSSQLGMSLVQSLFMFYYVRVFLNRFRIEQHWFQLAQVLFLVWNTINDPLFGLDLGGGLWRDRRRLIMLFSPFLAGSFLLLWFPWTGEISWITGVHFIVALFLYDGFYSFMSVAWSGLFSDSTRNHEGRVRAVQASQLAILISVNVLVVAEWFSNSLDNFAAFQVVAIVSAGLCIGGCCITGRLAPPTIDSPFDNPVPISARLLFDLARQMFSSPDFIRITATNFIHTCRSVAHLNFAAITTEAIIPMDVLPKGSWKISAFYGLCTLLPQILVICNKQILNRHGPYQLLMLSFYASFFCGLCAYFLLADFPYLVMFFMIFDSIAVHSMAPMFHILLADFVDDDLLRHNRSMNSFVVKPAQSLAPMLIVYFLQRAGYQQYQIDHQVTDSLRSSMFTLLCLIPVLLGAAQVIVFRGYSLRDKHEKFAYAHLSHL